MRKFALVVVGTLIVAAGAYYGVFVYPGERLRAAVDQVVAKLPPGISVTYQGARFSLMSRTAELTGVTLTLDGTTPYEVRIDSVTIHDPASGFGESWAGALKNPEALKPDEALPVADEIAYKGIKIVSGTITGAVESASVQKFRVYPWALMHPGVPTAAEIQPKFVALIQSVETTQKLQQRFLATTRDSQGQASPPDPLAVARFQDELKALQESELADAMPILRFESALLLGTGFDGGTVTGVDVKVGSQATNAMPGQTLRIGRYHIGNLDRGIGGESVMDGVSQDLGVSKSSIEHAIVKQSAFREPAMRLIEGAPLSLSILDGLSLGRVEADAVMVSLPTGGTTAIKSISYSDIAIDQGFLKSATIAMTGLKLTPDAIPDPASKQLFQRFGLTAMTVDMSGAYSWDADTSTAIFRDMLFKVDELGAITVNATIAGIAPGQPAPFDEATLAGATIRYDDASFVNRLLVYTNVKLSDEKLKQMRQKFASALLQNLARQPFDQQKMAPSIKALADFATEPHALVITLAPPEPVPLAMLQEIGAAGLPEVVDALGLSVAANP